MNTTLKIGVFFLAFIILFSSCASTTLIKSEPSGAKLYLDDMPVGTTPYEHSDTRIAGSCTSVRIEKEGYKTLNTRFCRDEEANPGPLIAGFFFLIPALWGLKYKSIHAYELEPITEEKEKKEVDEAPEEPKSSEEPTEKQSKSKADRLRELKELLDEGILTEEEFKREKEKILNEK
ncbi:PEGA domain-containing protein [Salibacter halophilus]|uniref:PEGA domain-containing protein n=1 Tax=Salibacter halophilus TaxID=1803916 RepID=A0A6N6M926_9FLAO|nr:PEGA domain-containing protein [Salibacter halophilus]KAB1065566.1 PEGA domain-containing protein [Salibacter halophilus]